MKVGLGVVYGDFKAVKKLKTDTPLYGCTCTTCGHKEKICPDTLLTYPLCSKHIQIPEATYPPTTEEQRKLDNVDPDEPIPEISLFEEQVDRINLLIDHSDTSNGIDVFQATALKTLIELIPYAEKQYREDPRQSNAYAINALITQIRELITDVTAKDDSTQLLMTILSQILQPAFLQLGQILLDNQHQMFLEMSRHIKTGQETKVRNIVNTNTKDIGRQFQDLFYDIKKQVGNLR